MCCSCSGVMDRDMRPDRRHAGTLCNIVTLVSSADYKLGHCSTHDPKLARAEMNMRRVREAFYFVSQLRV